MEYDIQLAKRNQLGNTANPYQGNAIKALTVCSAGLLRSPSIARYLTELGNYNTRAAGTSQDYALVPITQALLAWADEIHVVAEQASIVRKLLEYFGYDDTPIYEYDIPDEYGTFDPVLMDIIDAEYKRLVQK